MTDFNRNNGNRCPCKHCPNKGCGAYHSECEKYLGWRKEMDARKEAERLQRCRNDIISEAKWKQLWRNKRYSRLMTYNRSTKAD